MRSTLLFLCVGMTMVPVTQMSSRGFDNCGPANGGRGTTRAILGRLGSSREGLEGTGDQREGGHAMHMCLGFNLP